MNNLESISTGLLSIYGVLATLWTGGLGLAVKWMWNAARDRKANKKASDCGHAATHEELKYIVAGQNDLLVEMKRQRAAEQTLIDENAALREENEALKAKVKRLETSNARLTDAIPARAAVKKEKV